MIWLQSLLPGLSFLVPVLNTPNTMVECHAQKEQV